MKRTAWTLALVAIVAGARPAAADLIAVANDNHTIDVNGVLQAAKNPPPDTVAIVDIARFPPRPVATIDAPTSVVGAPTSVWISPDESWVIVTAATRIDPAHPDKIIPDDRVSVIDLKASPPQVVQTVVAGKGANEISVSPQGDFALVTNRTEGTISAFSVANKRLAPLGKIDLGNPKSLPSSVKFLPDGKTALLALYGDDAVRILRIAGGKVTLDPHKIVTGVNPYNLDINRAGTLATVGNMGGGGSGDICTVSLIDLTRNPPATIDTVAVPASPEGVKFSPDGHFIAVASIQGSTQAPNSPLFHAGGQLWVLAVENGELVPVAEAPIGRWSQGIAFSRDGRTILVESMIDHGLDMFRWYGRRLLRGKTLDLQGAPAAIRTSWP